MKKSNKASGQVAFEISPDSKKITMNIQIESAERMTVRQAERGLRHAFEQAIREIYAAHDDGAKSPGHCPYCDEVLEYREPNFLACTNRGCAYTKAIHQT